MSLLTKVVAIHKNTERGDTSEQTRTCETIIPLDLEIVSIYTKNVGWDGQHQIKQCAGQRSAVGNVSGYRCVSDCRSWGREFDPRTVPYFVEIDNEIASYM